MPGGEGTGSCVVRGVNGWPFCARLGILGALPQWCALGERQGALPCHGEDQATRLLGRGCALSACGRLQTAL